MIDQVPPGALQFDGAGALVSCTDPLIAKTGWIRNLWRIRTVLTEIREEKRLNNKSREGGH